MLKNVKERRTGFGPAPESWQDPMQPLTPTPHKMFVFITVNETEKATYDQQKVCQSKLKTGTYYVTLSRDLLTIFYFFNVQIIQHVVCTR